MSVINLLVIHTTPFAVLTLTLCAWVSCHSIASFKLDEYETARDCFSKGLELAPTNNNFKTWIRKCDAEIAG